MSAVLADLLRRACAPGVPTEQRDQMLSGIKLSGADLGRADLSGANLSGVDLGRADLSGANLSGADLWGANLSGANLRRANLSGADLSGADLWGANLSGANLRRANLSGANLRRADLSGADLSGANLWGANLWDADLWRADLRDANLSGANLWGANLSGANLLTGGVASLGPTPSGDVVIFPTPGGWVMQVGCWRGSPDELRALIARDDGWPVAGGEEVARRRPWLEIALAHADLVMMSNPGLIGVLSAQWGSPDDRRAES